MKAQRSLESMIAQGAAYANLQAELHTAQIYQAAHKTNVARVIGLDDDAFYDMQYDAWVDLRTRFAAWFLQAKAAFQAGELPTVNSDRSAALLTEYMKINPFAL